MFRKVGKLKNVVSMNVTKWRGVTGVKDFVRHFIFGGMADYYRHRRLLLGSAPVRTEQHKVPLPYNIPVPSRSSTNSPAPAPEALECPIVSIVSTSNVNNS